MYRLNKWQIISLLISAFIVAFIFVNSAQTGEESSSISGGILDFINNMLAACNIDIAFSHTVLRKIGHFLGFFLVGTSFLITTATFTKRIGANIFKPMFAALFTAVIDETIQLLTPGRSSQVSDVLLDFSGAFCAIMLTWFIISKINKKRCQD